jgi:ribose 5-phosphate isomerase B
MTTPPFILIGSDHGGFTLKEALKEQLRHTNTIKDMGCYTDDRVDYPDIAATLAKEVLSTPYSVGILICGTGIGISIKANRYPGIRAALIHSTFTAEMAKAHNNANILCLGGRTTSVADAMSYIQTWQETSYEGGRHADRLHKLDAPL